MVFNEIDISNLHNKFSFYTGLNNNYKIVISVLEFSIFS